MPIAHPPTIDVRVLGFAVVLTIATGLVFGLIPVLRLGRVDVAGLREGARAGSGARERVRGALVVAEVALSVVLLVSAGLLLRALWTVQRVDPGFRTSGVLTLRTDLPRPRYEATATRVAFYDRVLAEVRALPGVTDAAYIGGLPLVRGGGIWPVTLKGQATMRGGGDTASLRFVTPDYFKTMAIPLRRGRDFNASDTADRQAAAIVSESLAQRLWPDTDPIGHTFTLAFSERVVVGVVGDVHVRGLERTSEPQVYAAYRQVGDGSLIGYFPNDLAVHVSSGDPAALAAANPRDHSPRRSGAADLRRADDRSDRRAQDGVARRAAPRDRVLCRAGAPARGRRHPRLALVHGLAAHAGDRRPHRAGRRAARDSRDGHARSRGPRAHWRRRRAARSRTRLAARCRRCSPASRPATAWTFAVAIAAAIAFELAGSLLPAIRASRVDPVSAIRL